MRLSFISHTVFTLASSLALAARISAADVSWVSPAAGETYGSGDSFVGRWTSSSAIVTPSFRLCVADGGNGEDGAWDDVVSTADGNSASDAGTSEAGSSAFSESQSKQRQRRLSTILPRQDMAPCGPATWAEVTQADGEYSVSLAVPMVTNDSEFYLQMEDNFGQTYSSPSFSLSPSTAPHTASLVRSPSSTSTSTSTAALLVAHHASVPVAAYAVPLTIVGVICLAALFFFLRARRQTLSERAAATRALSEKPSSLSNGSIAGTSGALNRLSFGGWRSRLSVQNSVDVEKALVLADAIEVLAARGRKGGRPQRRATSDLDDPYTALPERCMPRGPRAPRPRLREHDLGSFDADDILQRAQCISPPATYVPPPRFAYGPRDTREETDEDVEAYEGDHYQPPSHAPPRTIPRSTFVASVAASQSSPRSSTSTDAAGSIGGLRAPPGLPGAPNMPNVPATASVLASYMQPSPIPPSLPMPAFDGEIEEPIRREHPALLTPRLGTAPPPVPPKQAHVRGPSGVSLPRRLSEEEAYQKVRVVVGDH